MGVQLIFKFIFFLFTVVCFCQENDSPSNTQIADTLDAQGKYKESILYRDLALNEKDHSKSYLFYIQAKWHYTQSCILEATGGVDNHQKALLHSIKAKEIASKISSSAVYFKHEIANRIYHQYGYSGDWKNALIEAKENYNILKDTFPDQHPKMLWIIDDLGYIYKALHDNEASLKYYHWSVPLYKKYHPKKIEDLAMNYNRMATNYRDLGLRKKEYQILKESEHIWDDKFIEGYWGSKFSCYEQLVIWNIYYGNTEQAEHYLSKQEALMPKLIARLKDTERPYLSRRYYLRIYYNYIELYIKSEQFKKVKTYLELFSNQLGKTKAEHQFEAHFKALYFSYLAKMPDVDKIKEIAHLKEAIAIAETNEKTFYTDSKPYKIQLLKAYLKENLNQDALKIIADLLNGINETDDNLKFFLMSNKANIHLLQGKDILASKEFKESLQFLFGKMEGPVDFRNVSFDDLKPFYTFETVDGLLMASKFYELNYRKNSNESDLYVAKNFVILASKVFDKLYLGDRYNANLFNCYKKIEQQALVALTLNSNKNDIKRILEALENNATKYTWSKFVYSKTRRNLNVPDTLINRENELKSLIHYYQNELFKKNGERLNLDTLKLRLSETNFELQKLQNSIKLEFSSYYNNNFRVFNISEFQKTIPDDQKILKYIISEGKLFCFNISKFEIKFQHIEQPENFELLIDNYIATLKKYNSDIRTSLSKIKPVFPSEIKTTSDTKIIIIPDGILCYLPFEALLETNQFLSSKNTLSYASSLSLLKDQNNASNPRDVITLGFFSGNYSGAKKLPNVLDEEASLLTSFSGQSFSNVSAKNLVKNAKEFDVLHFAMHSTIDRENPDFSNFNLGNERLLMSSLYHESFKAQMAVLSAFETGGGHFVDGEGIQSVSRAFTYTGIPSVVMSLWKVDDASTTKIMSEFYKNLKKGEPKDVALKNAKISYIESVEDEALKHPYYWAGFIVSGNTTALVEPNVSIYWCIGLFIVLIVLFFIFRKRINPTP